MLDSNDLKVLRYFHYHMPMDFLKELELFQTYPFHLLVKRYEAVAYKYYGPDKVITKDSENSQWIYVVKSGTAKIVKKMRLHNKEPELTQMSTSRLNLKPNALRGEP